MAYFQFSAFHHLRGEGRVILESFQQMLHCAPLYPNRLFPREGRTTSWSTFQTCTKISLHWQLLRLILNISKRLSDWMTSLFTTTDCIRYKTAVSLQLYLLDQEKFFFFKFWSFLKEFLFELLFVIISQSWSQSCFSSGLGTGVSLFHGSDIEMTRGCKLCFWLFSDYEIVILLLPKICISALGSNICYFFDQ